MLPGDEAKVVGKKKASPLLEVANVFVCFDHVACVIENADHSLV